MAQERDKLFPYDVFIIVLLVAAASGSILISLSYLEELIYFADKFAFLFFLTAAIIALLFAMFAAFLKHEQNNSDKKASDNAQRAKQLSEGDKGDERVEKAIIVLKKEAQKRVASAKSFLKFSNMAIKGSLLSLIIGFIFIIVSIWTLPVANMLSGSETGQTDQAEVNADDEEQEEEE